MYELIQISDSSYYIQSPAKIGLVKLNDKEVCLIDSGNDKDAGRKVRQILDANCWKLTATLILIPTQTISEATSICKDKQVAKFMHRG